VTLDQRVTSRLGELIEQGDKVLQTQWGDNWSSYVDAATANQWGVSCLNILARVFGCDSDHYTRFNELFHRLEHYDATQKALGILKGAADDYAHDYLFDMRSAIAAEVFDDFLGQAEYLLSGDYDGPAAVIAGSVLEDGLRKLCQRRGIALGPKPKLDTMNAEMAKDGAYNLLVQKQVTALADLRNKAAHGQLDQFGHDDVVRMVAQVRSFMETHFS